MRVNVEESVWTDIRFQRLASALDVPLYMAVGVMVHLWRCSQSNEADAWTRDDLEILLGSHTLAPTVENLSASGLLHEEKGKYRLGGMKQRLEEISEYQEKKRNAGRLGGIKSGEKRRSKKEASASTDSDQIEPSMSMSMSMSMSSPELNPLENENHSPNKIDGDMSGIANADFASAQSTSPQPDFVEVEIVEKKSSPPRKPKPKPLVSEADEKLGQRWFSWTKSLSPHINATPASFSVGIFETKRALARSMPNGDLDALMEALFAFIQRDKFWGKNCLSPCGLLSKSSNGLRKVDNVIKDMRGREFREKQNSLLPDSETDWSKII